MWSARCARQAIFLRATASFRSSAKESCWRFWTPERMGRRWDRTTTRAGSRAEVLVDGARATVIRRQEGVEDLLRMEK